MRKYVDEEWDRSNEEEAETEGKVVVDVDLYRFGIRLAASIVWFLLICAVTAGTYFTSQGSMVPAYVLTGLIAGAGLFGLLWWVSGKVFKQTG